MSNEKKENILVQFDEMESLYKALTKKTELLISEILVEKNLHIHSITSRVKERSSLEKKLQKDDKNYSSIDDITDLSGVRITTYFEDDVDKISNLIESEFKIDKDNSVDKRILLDPDRFGYLSLHHVVSITDKRLKLIEYSRFKNLKVEIQIRSILQHAWAEIEHDLGYKNKQSVPRLIKRRFSRLSGLLEIADQEFISIRDELTEYEEDLKKNIQKAPKDYFLDSSSLVQFLKSNKIIKDIDKTLANYIKGYIRPLNQNKKKGSDIEVTRLKYFNINTIYDLEESLKDNFQLIKEFGKIWLEGSTIKSFGEGISLFYLSYVLSAQNEDVEKIATYLDKFTIGTDRNMGSNDLAKEVLETYTLAKQN